jgi:hypothetical protein
MSLFKHDPPSAALRQAVGAVSRAIPVLALLLLLGACGGESKEVPADVRETQPDLIDPEAITESDSGGTFTLAAGTETSLRLSSEYVWDDPVVDGDAVELGRVDYLQDPGFSEWLVQAMGPGTATISALGEPACAGEDGCPDAPLRFQVTITVAE